MAHHIQTKMLVHLQIGIAYNNTKQLFQKFQQNYKHTTLCALKS
jgi:hypothetical protein